MIIITCGVSFPRLLADHAGSSGVEVRLAFPLTASTRQRVVPRSDVMPSTSQPISGIFTSFHSTPCSKAHYYRVCQPPIQHSAPMNHKTPVASLVIVQLSGKGTQHVSLTYPKNGVMECVCDWSGFWAFGQT